MKEKIAGIIGGMGPEATLDLMRRVLRATPAEDDSDHIRMIVDNNPKVPSRIKALIDETGESPAPCLVEMARGLARMGADFLAVPCNTAHLYLDQIRNAIPIPVLDMVESSIRIIMAQNPDLRRAGLLASDAVLKTSLYLDRFRVRDVDLLYPEPARQHSLMDAIKAVKTGRYGPVETQAVESAAEDLVQKGAQVLVVACTELSLITGALEGPPRIYDTAQILAEEIVAAAKGWSDEKKRRTG